MLRNRPAETTTAVLGTGGLVAAIAIGNWLAAATAAIAYVPAIVTYLHDHGGIRGLAAGLWHGDPE